MAKTTKTSPTAELLQKKPEALLEEIRSLQKAHFGLRMQKATQQLTNTSALRKTRRSIARAKTVLGQVLAKQSLAS